jgi:hypothetical protein
VQHIVVILSAYTCAYFVFEAIVTFNAFMLLLPSAILFLLRQLASGPSFPTEVSFSLFETLKRGGFDGKNLRSAQQLSH